MTGGVGVHAPPDLLPARPGAGWHALGGKHRARRDHALVSRGEVADQDVEVRGRTRPVPAPG